MSAFIHHELLLLLRTIAVGAVLLLCYDLLAAFRDPAFFFGFRLFIRSVYLPQDSRRYFCKMLYEIYGDSCNNY